MRPAIAAATLVVLAAGPAAADVFVLANGQEVDGYSGGTTAKKEVVVLTASGPRRFAEATVKEVRPSKDPESDFQRYFKGLGKKDADGASWLGSWAKARGLPERAKESWERAISINSDHAAARELLGYLKVDGRWLTPEQAEAYKKENAERLELADRYEKSMGVRPEVTLSAHYRFADYLSDGKTPDRLKDLEAAFDEGVRVFGSDPWRGRCLVVACEGMEQYVNWVGKEAGPLPGTTPEFLDFWKKATGMKFTSPPILARSDLPDRSAMHAANVHAAGHLLLNNWKVDNRKQPFWLEEGFGGWIEAEVLKSNSSFCWHKSKKGYGTTFRGTEAWDVEFPDWKALVKDTAAKNGFLPLDQLDALPQGEYGKREVGQSFSLVAFLIREKGPEKFRAFVELVKQGKKSQEALTTSMGETFESLEPVWRGWVQGRW